MPTHHPSFWRVAALALAIGSLPAMVAAAPLTEGEAIRISLARPELNDLAHARTVEAEADLTEANT